MACSKFKFFLFALWLQACGCLTVSVHQPSEPQIIRASPYVNRLRWNRGRFLEASRSGPMHLKGGGGINMFISPLIGFLKSFGGVAASAIVVLGFNLLGFGITIGTGTHLVTDLVGTGAIGVAAALSSLANDGPTSCRSHAIINILRHTL